MAYCDIFCIFPYLTCRLIVVKLLVTLRTTNDPSIALTGTFSSSISSPTPSHADLDMRKVMLAAGGPNYETVLHDADIQMGPNSQIIPSKRCGGEARRANLKRKARYTTQSVAETFVYCTLNTVSTENAADIIQTFANVRICCCYYFSLLCP